MSICQHASKYPLNKLICCDYNQQCYVDSGFCKGVVGPNEYDQISKWAKEFVCHRIGEMNSCQRNRNVSDTSAKEICKKENENKLFCSLSDVDRDLRLKFFRSIETKWVLGRDELSYSAYACCDEQSCTTQRNCRKCGTKINNVTRKVITEKTCIECPTDSFRAGTCFFYRNDSSIPNDKSIPNNDCASNEGLCMNYKLELCDGLTQDWIRERLSTGEIVGIVFGVLSFFAAIIGLIFAFKQLKIARKEYRKKKKEKERENVGLNKEKGGNNSELKEKVTEENLENKEEKGDNSELKDKVTEENLENKEEKGDNSELKDKVTEENLET